MRHTEALALIDQTLKKHAKQDKKSKLSESELRVVQLFKAGSLLSLARFHDAAPIYSIISLTQMSFWFLNLSSLWVKKILNSFFLSHRCLDRIVKNKQSNYWKSIFQLLIQPVCIDFTSVLVFSLLLPSCF